MLTADCGNSSYGYLDICDKLLNGSTSPAASAPIPSATEPTVALAPDAASPATSPVDTGGVTTQRSVYLQPYCQYAAMLFRCAAVSWCSLAETGDNIHLLLLVVMSDLTKCSNSVLMYSPLHCKT